MSLVFYHGAGSPFSWRVHLALLCKGLAFESRLLSFRKREHRTAEMLALNPRGKVPILVHGEVVLYESVAIVEYLDERFAGETPSVLGTDLIQRAHVRRVVSEVDQHTWPVVAALLDELMKPEQDWSLSLFTNERERLQREVGFYAGYLARAPAPGFLFGPTPTFADFALYACLAVAERLSKRTDEVGVELAPALVDWKRRIVELPYHDETFPAHWR